MKDNRTKREKAIAAMARVIVKYAGLTRSAFTATEWTEIEKINEGKMHDSVCY